MYTKSNFFFFFFFFFPRSSVLFETVQHLSLEQVPWMAILVFTLTEHNKEFVNMNMHACIQFTDLIRYTDVFRLPYFHGRWVCMHMRSLY